ncbi:threonine aldolase family protein [Micromonospora sp. CA-248089]|uniref:threonine aldolase family protein n=1 Tax=Micromonospora sp. CA-248089 TaxID=3239960 RepID=UPI003D8C4275
MTPVDLRSDTRTVPDDAMRKAMSVAAVGDDSYGDDPTVAELEETAAGLLGTDAAVFTPSTTMSNLLAVLLWLGTDGGVLVVGRRAHVVTLENDGARRLARAHLVTLADPAGHLSPAEVTAALPGPAGRTLLWLENTANLAGGHAQTPAELATSARAGRAGGARVHLDGARLTNAAVATGSSLADLAAPADTVALSLSKGLGAPAGALLAGPASAIAEARELRQMLGGTMHQAGVLAAAGLVALGRRHELARDHERADRLREGLGGIDGVDVVEVDRPTNMVFLRRVGTPAEVTATRLAENGVLVLPVGDDTVRLVVHRQHTDDDIEAVTVRAALALRPNGRGPA